MLSNKTEHADLNEFKEGTIRTLEGEIFSDARTSILNSPLFGLQ